MRLQRYICRRQTLENILESGKPLAKQDGILSVNQGEQEVVVEIGSGTYEFVYKFLEQ